MEKIFDVRGSKGYPKYVVERYNNGLIDKCANCEYAERYFTENGFAFHAIGMSNDGVNYAVMRDGVKMRWKVYSDPKASPELQMDAFSELFDLLVKCIENGVF